jgi:signal transduction histidine kinase
LGTDDVTCVTSDLQGRIYACAGRGIDRLDPASGRVRRFDITDGLANEQVKTAWRDAAGDLWFGTMLGLSRLHVTPDPKPGAARVLVTGVEIDGAALALPEIGATKVGGPRFAMQASRLRVAFAAPGADLDAAPAFRYRLSPVESAWSAPSRDRAVTYAGLRPGRYRFSVQAVSGGVATGPAAAVELAILPPWWRRTWALAALAVLVVAAAYALHRQRVARLLAVERVRSRIAADLHDDLGASLTRIAVLSELARQKGPQGDGAPELRQIADTARQLTDEASDIVWSIDPHHDDLASLLARLRRLAADLLGERGIELEFAAPPDAEAIRLSADQRRNLLMVLKEALHNAARHAGARRVEVRIEATGSALLAVVRDDGRGFDVTTPAATANGGRGLPNLRARARALEGAVDVRSEPGSGTTITLSMPR